MPPTVEEAAGMLQDIVRKARETEAIKALQKVFRDAGLIGSP